VNVRKTLMRWLDRGDAAETVGDPEAAVEIANVSIFEGPRLVTLLADSGIEAHGIEATTDALHFSAQTRMRILVGCREADAAFAALRGHGLAI
jgi:hypothetical protein